MSQMELEVSKINVKHEVFVVDTNHGNSAVKAAKKKFADKHDVRYSYLKGMKVTTVSGYRSGTVVAVFENPGLAGYKGL